MVEGLSKITQTNLLQNLFERYPGFKDVNHIVPKQVAFIEFETDDFATSAMMAMNGYSFKESDGETTTLRVTYAKR